MSLFFYILIEKNIFYCYFVNYEGKYSILIWAGDEKLKYR